MRFILARLMHYGLDILCHSNKSSIFAIQSIKALQSSFPSYLGASNLTFWWKDVLVQAIEFS